MADVDFDDIDAGYGAPVAPANRVSRLVNIAGAVSSVALVIGLGVWGYNLAVRDVNGVPVIRAMDGPMRMTPENPGGEVADHQGLAVNDVAAIGVAQPPPDRLLLAPRPVELTDEDLPGLASAQIPESDAARAPALVPDGPQVAESRSASPAIPVLPGATPDPVTDAVQGVVAPAPVAGMAPSTAPDPTRDAVAMALAEAMDAPLADATLDAAAPSDGFAAPTVDPPADTGSPAVASLRPRARPANFAPAAAVQDAPVQDVALAAPAIVAPAAEIDPATLSEGTRLVQLGAFDTADDARGEWGRLMNRHGELLTGKSVVVQSAESGGRTFFRLRAAGFTTEGEARALCTALLERNASCIPVVHR